MKHKGHKLTPQRRKVISAIALSQEHLTPAAIYEKLHRQYPNIGLVTVYRTLDILIEMGLVCIVHSEGNGKSYLLRRPAEHHHHLICSNCGTVVDFTAFVRIARHQLIAASHQHHLTNRRSTINENNNC